MIFLSADVVLIDELYASHICVTSRELETRYLAAFTYAQQETVASDQGASTW